MRAWLKATWPLFTSIWLTRSGAFDASVPPAAWDALAPEVMENGVHGRVTSQGGWLKRKIFYGSSFQTRLRFRITPTEGGSRILYESSVNLVVQVFMALWFGFIGLWWPLAVFSTLMLPMSQWWMAPLFWLAPIPLLAFGYALVTFGRWMARDEHDILLRALQRPLETHFVP